jgi:hypothetical protein
VWEAFLIKGELLVATKALVVPLPCRGNCKNRQSILNLVAVQLRIVQN